MKRILYRLLAAFFTLALGIIVTHVVRSHRFFIGPSVRSTGSGFSCLLLQPQTITPKNVQVVDDKIDSLEAGYIDGDKLSYKGYDVERSTDARGHQSAATIKKNGRTIARLRNGGLGKDSTRFGLFSLLGGESKQLVILQYTGGAHCCWTYRIYDFQPSLRVIFDDENYGLDYLGYELQPEDIDGDGRYELTQAVMTFDYFHMSHASSVFPTAVFSYDKKSRAYVPVNKRFSAYVLDDVAKDLKSLELVGRDVDANHELYLSAVLKVLLKKIYAGDETDGWRFFDSEYRLTDKAEIKSDIKKALRHDPVYQSIYNR
ncbi:MAG TPA: hypothetical protein VGW58_00790 [Pyrinomonadaceae bacterium]|nr:hypothetical protein [Pyrinomonadaceae bacterium]